MERNEEANDGISKLLKPVSPLMPTNNAISGECSRNESSVAILEQPIGDLPCDTSRSLNVDNILGHFYKAKIVRFRTQCNKYDLITVHALDEMLSNYPELTSKYIRSLTTRATNTLITRHPRVLEILRKD